MKRFVALGLTAIVLAACGKDTVEPPADLIEFDASLDVRQVWRRKVGGGTERLRLGLTPGTDGVRIYSGAHNGDAAAYSITDGAEIWSVETGLPLSAGPGVGGGQVVFGTTDGDLVALDAESGAERWRIQVSGEVLAPPVVGNAVIVFHTADGRLNAVDADGGGERWTVSHQLPLLTLRGTSAPLVVNGLVIAGFDNGRVGAYRIETGIPVWEQVIASPTGRTDIDRLVDVGIDIEVLGQDVYASTYQGRAVRMDLLSGEFLWQPFESSSFAGIGVDTQHVYVTDAVGTVIALSRLTGNEVWRQSALRLRDLTAATRFREAVVVADFDGYVHWLDAQTGEFLARARAGSGKITAQPLVVGPTVFVQSEDGTVAAYEIVDETA